METPTESTEESSNVIGVPEYFYAVDIEYLTHMIADMLGRLITHNDLIPLTPSNLTRFHSRTAPNISLSDYLRRIVKYASVEKSCLLILLIYIDRICELHPHFTISSLTVHRFLITAVAVSSKSLCDSFFTNSHYAKVGGISTRELNALELEFLTFIDWHLASSGLVLQQYYVNLVQQHPCYDRIRAVDDADEKSKGNYVHLVQRQSCSDRTCAAEGSAEKGYENQKPPAALGNKKRRRSSAERIMEDTVELSEHNKAKNQCPVATEEDQKTLRHFDELLDNDNIPYIA